MKLKKIRKKMKLKEKNSIKKIKILVSQETKLLLLQKKLFELVEMRLIKWNKYYF